ncbi:hypothetical protein BH10PAT1_BH10PAT1_6250 [soil metagenome]
MVKKKIGRVFFYFIPIIIIFGIAIIVTTVKVLVPKIGNNIDNYNQVLGARADDN